LVSVSAAHLVQFRLVPKRKLLRIVVAVLTDCLKKMATSLLVISWKRQCHSYFVVLELQFEHLGFTMYTSFKQLSLVSKMSNSYLLSEMLNSAHLSE